jgi:hypothetical protein
MHLRGARLPLRLSLTARPTQRDRGDPPATGTDDLQDDSTAVLPGPIASSHQPTRLLSLLGGGYSSSSRSAPSAARLQPTVAICAGPTPAPLPQRPPPEQSALYAKYGYGGSQSFQWQQQQQPAATRTTGALSATITATATPCNAAIHPLSASSRCWICAAICSPRSSNSTVASSC